MPTNYLRRAKTAPRPAGRPGAVVSPADRRAILTVGMAQFELELHPTPTADAVWRALPINSVAETWGDSLHFEVPVRAGRDRTARMNARPGDLYFWPDEARILMVWGMTPISRDGEIRLMRPCNVWATALGDLTALDGLVPGGKVSLIRAQA